MKKSLLLLFLLSFFNLSAQNEPSSSNRILQNLQKLNTLGSVLYIAAHPDDENTRLLAYMANERHYRTAYLSLTRGDGGQNLIGTEQGDELGLIRTQELLAARRIDGAEQFFTRANDFGFSKNPEETFSIWGKEDILRDVVWTIRKFRPDIIITRFPTTGEGGHGHHTASAILAVEAFDAAADPKRFPEQLKYVQVWQPKRLFWNNFMPSRDAKTDLSGMLKLDAGTYNALLGESIGEIAAKSRSQHKSQGFGVKITRGEMLEFFTQLKGDPVKADLMEGIFSGWSRIANGGQITLAIQSLISGYDPFHPEATIPKLVEIHSMINKIDDAFWKEIKGRELEDILIQCAGVFADFTAADHAVSPGQVVPTTFSFIFRQANMVNLLSMKATGIVDSVKFKNIFKNKIYEEKVDLTIPAGISSSNPYWLEKPHAAGVFVFNDVLLTGTPESKPTISSTVTFSINGIRITRNYPLIYKWVDPVKGELSRIVQVLPKVTAVFNAPVFTFTSTDSHTVIITLNGNGDSLNGELSLNLPEFIECRPKKLPVTLGKNKSQTYSFILSVSPTREVKPEMRTDVTVELKDLQTNKTQVLKSVERISYDHIPIQTRIKDASFVLVHTSMIRKGINLGYVVGAGDEVATCLINAGYTVTMLDEKYMKPELLKAFDAIIVGIRAFNANENMGTYMPSLLEYVKDGGTLIEQYNTKNWISNVKVQPGPYAFEISRDRVTDEKATMKILVADHPVFSFPNRITQADFDGWVQERGLYFPEKWDAAYTPLLECGDPGEPAKQGALLVADYGKGKFIYTGISFFRQLPAGVPGAYRLMANLIGLGKYDGK